MKINRFIILSAIGLFSNIANLKAGSCDSLMNEDKPLFSKLFAQAEPQIDFSGIKENTYNLSISYTSAKDTYLSPLYYSGLGLNFSITDIKNYRKFDFKNRTPKSSIFAYTPKTTIDWILIRDEMQFDIAYLINPAKTHIAYYFDFDINRNYLFRVLKSKFGNIYLGSGIDLSMGAIYNTANGNNPVSINAQSSIVASLLYNYRLAFRSFPANIKLYASTSIFTLSFNPNFGESYYQIFSLNDSVLSKLHFRFSPLKRKFVGLSFDIPIWDYTIMSLGTKYYNYSSHINELDKSVKSLAFSIGFTTNLQTISGRKLLNSETNYKLAL